MLQRLGEIIIITYTNVEVYNKTKGIYTVYMLFFVPLLNIIVLYILISDTLTLIHINTQVYSHTLTTITA